MELSVSTSHGRRKAVSLTPEQLSWALRWSDLRISYWSALGYDTGELECEKAGYWDRLQAAIPHLRDAESPAPMSAGTTTTEGWG